MSAAGGLVVRQGTTALEGSRDWATPPLQPEPGAKLRALFKAAWRRRRLIFLTLLALNIAAFVAVRMVKPRYTGEATLIIGSRQAQVLDLKSVLAGLGGDSEAIESEIQLLRSRKIARTVVQQLRLDQDPEFRPLEKAPGLVSQALSVARDRWNGVIDARLPALHWPTPATPDKVQDPLAQTVDNVLRRLSIAAKGRSRVVSVTFDSNNPATAAEVANEFANAYITDQLRQKREATASAHKWLEDRVAEMREQVINADQAVAAYRRRAGITPSRTGTLLTEQISSLGEQVVQARIARANAESRLQSFGANGPGPRIDNLPEVQASATIQALRAQQSTMESAAAELARNLGDNHPRVAAARAAAGAVEGRIRAETAKVAASLSEDAKSARARETALNASLDRARRDVASGTESEVELHALQHEAEANRALYDRLLARSRETNVEGGLQQPDAQVVSSAEAPEQPSFPNPVIILPIFFLASCIATALLVFGLEARDTGFSSLDQVELVLGAAALGVMPRLRRADRGRRMIASSRQERDNSAFAEAVRNLHTGLMLSGADRPPKVVLVTSALPGEGRSSIVLSLARLMANVGKRVVVVDCDLRRPALHKAFGVSRGPGLTECLAGKVALVDALQPDSMSPALLLAAGAPGGVSPDLLGSEAMRELLATLSDRFDLVVLDSSPVLALSDTRNLCRLADRTVLAVRWQDTRRFVVAAALRMVLDAGGKVAGILLSNVDLKGYAKFSTAGAYQRRIGLYLSE